MTRMTPSRSQISGLNLELLEGKENNFFDRNPELKTEPVEPRRVSQNQNRDEEDINGLKGKIEILQNQIENMKDKESERIRGILKRDLSKERFQEQNTQNYPKINELQIEIEKLKMSNNQLQMDLNRAQMQNGNNQVLIDNLNETKELNNNLKSMVRMKDNEAEQLRRRLEDLNRKHEEHKSENQQLRDKIEKLVKEKNDQVIPSPKSLNSDQERENYRLRQTNLFLFNLLTDNYKTSKELFDDNRMDEESMAGDRLVEYIQELKKNSYRMEKGLSDDNTSLLRRDHDVVIDGLQNLRKTVREKKGFNSFKLSQVEDDPKFRMLKQKYDDLLMRLNSREPRRMSNIRPPINSGQIIPGRRLVSISPNNNNHNSMRRPSHNLFSPAGSQNRIPVPQQPVRGVSSNNRTFRGLSPVQRPSIPIQQPARILSPNNGVILSPNTQILTRGMPVTNRGGLSASPVVPRVTQFSPSRSPIRQTVNHLPQPVTQIIPRSSIPGQGQPRIIQQQPLLLLPRRSQPKLSQPRLSANSNQVPRISTGYMVPPQNNNSLRYDSRYTSKNSGGSNYEPVVHPLQLNENPDQRDDSLPKNLRMRGKPIPNKERNKISIDGSPTSTLHRDNSQESMWNRAMMGK